MDTWLKSVIVGAMKPPESSGDCLMIKYVAGKDVIAGLSADWYYGHWY
jgi:hypothetical protein